MVAFLYGGAAAVSLCAILIVVEVVFSFDNAAVNAKYLGRLNHFWQTMFLTVGILVAVVGMRLVFPFVIVSLSGGIGPIEAVQLALAKGDPETPGTYGYILNEAHPAIAAFGGIFLLMLFLDFLFADKEHTWLSWVERPLLRAGRLDMLAALVSMSTLLVLSRVFAEGEESFTVLFAGVLGLATYVAVTSVAALMTEREEERSAELAEVTGTGGDTGLSGRAAFSLFVFLNVLDSSFSFDGVIGAFAITPDPVIIALGLGVGALFVRSATLYLVRRGTLAEYRYLEHGAHWAIGALAVLLLVTLEYEIPDLVIGLVGIVFIAASWRSSVRANERHAAGAGGAASEDLAPDVAGP